MPKFQQREVLVCKVTFISVVEANNREEAEALFSEGSSELVGEYIGDCVDGYPNPLDSEITELGAAPSKA